MDRREFIKGAACSLGVLSIPLLGRGVFGTPSDPIALEKKSCRDKKIYYP